jgi:N-acetylmuramic acid 6-phosphate etherase
MEFEKITEEQGPYRHLERMSTHELLTFINKGDQQVPLAVAQSIPQIEKLTEIIIDKMLGGGRLFYLGAGTSGRLGILDASEIPPTYGMPYGLIIGLIAGGEKAIRTPVENAEDDKEQGWLDLCEFEVNEKDVVIGIKISTGCVTCNPGTPLAAASDYPVEAIVGPEFVTGSTRMKSGTAQKLVLNMISTTVMIRIGRVEDTSMVNMQLTNSKLIERGISMLMNQTGISDYQLAKSLLLRHGSVKNAAESRRKV